GRPFEEIERSTLQSVDLKRHAPAQVVDWFGELADAGAQHVIFSLRDVWDLRHIETIGREVIPAVQPL
ncbi:MAG TPA: hypothetical protein VH723_00775, partial [Candidatus Limnocylindrales bacterium]